VKQNKSFESSSRRKARIAAAPKLRTRVTEDKTKYKRAREKRKSQSDGWYIQDVM
jgi:hypothetical protein